MLGGKDCFTNTFVFKVFYQLPLYSKSRKNWRIVYHLEGLRASMTVTQLTLPHSARGSRSSLIW